MYNQSVDSSNALGLSILNGVNATDFVFVDRDNYK